MNNSNHFRVPGAVAALNQASLLGGQKEAIASVLQHFARSLRLNRAAIAKATAEEGRPEISFEQYHRRPR